MRSKEIHQRPHEDFSEYMARLEKARLQVIGEDISRRADILEGHAEDKDDREMRVAARAERAAANEYFKAVRDMERGAE